MCVYVHTYLIRLYDSRSRGTELNDRTMVAVNPLAFCEVSEDMEIPLNKLELQT